MQKEKTRAELNQEKRKLKDKLTLISMLKLGLIIFVDEVLFLISSFLQSTIFFMPNIRAIGTIGMFTSMFTLYSVIIFGPNYCKKKQLEKFFKKHPDMMEENEVSKENKKPNQVKLEDKKEMTTTDKIEALKYEKELLLHEEEEEKEYEKTKKLK